MLYIIKPVTMKQIITSVVWLHQLLYSKYIVDSFQK